MNWWDYAFITYALGFVLRAMTPVLLAMSTDRWTIHYSQLLWSAAWWPVGALRWAVWESWQ